MNNFRFPGRSIQWTNTTGADVKSGDPVVIGERVGCAAVDIAIGATGTVDLGGVFEWPKVAGVLVQGDKLYYDTVAKNFTKTAAGNVRAGFAFQAQANGDLTTFVFLDPTPGKAVFVAQIATADATDLASSEALANANKVKINALLTALINAGFMLNA
jgi:predicted RecA/RadA family phage recombinase